MEILALAFVCGLISAVIASSRGDFGWAYFFLGGLLGPLGIVMAITQTGKECPACRAKNHTKATRCGRCGGDELGGIRRP